MKTPRKKYPKQIQRRLDNCEGVVSLWIDPEIKRNLIIACYEQGLKQRPVEVELIEQAFIAFSIRPKPIKGGCE